MTAEQRLEICKKCPLMKTDPVYGPTCDNKKWMDPKTGMTSRLPHAGWVHGCGCHLSWRVKNLSAHCINGKW